MTVPVAIVGLSLGGPDEPAAVEPYLAERLSDPMAPVFAGGAMGRRLLARRFAARQAPALRARYASIGGASPALTYVMGQVEGVVERLNLRAGAKRYRGYVALRYWVPFARDAVRRILAAGVRRVVLLPLLPFESPATIGTCLRAFRDAMEAVDAELEWSVVDPWYAHASYLELLARRIGASARDLERTEGRLPVLCSVTGLPKHGATRGNPYAAQVEATLAGLRARLPQDLDLEVVHQPFLGRSSGPGPEIQERIRELSTAGAAAMLVVPLLPVYDDLETLYELDIRCAGIAREAGASGFRRAPALNDDPSFIDALTRIVEDHLLAGEPPLAR